MGTSMHIKHLKISLKITADFIKIQTKKRKKGIHKIINLCLDIFYIFLF